MTPEEFYKEIGADYQTALSRMMGNQGLLARMLKKFENDRNYEALEKAVENEDYGGVFAAAHTLKGVTGNLSFNRLYEKVSEVVEPLRREDLEEAGKKLPALTDAYEELIRVLEEWEA